MGNIHILMARFVHVSNALGHRPYINPQRKKMMKKTLKFRNILASTLLAAGLASVAPAALANLLTNGDFQTGTFAGWTQGGNFTYSQVLAGYGVSGSYGAKLGPVGSDGILSQSFSTVAGTKYRLAFWMSSEGSAPNDFSAALGSHVVFSQTNIPAQSYALYSYDFTGTGHDSVTFKFRNDPGYLGLDTVSVEKIAEPQAAVPEPASLALIGLGLAGIAQRRRRARAANV